MKGIISDAVIVMLVAANILVAVLSYNAGRPVCFAEGCNRARVTGERFCHEHSELMNEREICQEVTIKN